MASYSSSQLAPASSLAVPGSSNVAPVFYRMLEGDWPVLKQASAISASVMERIRSDGSGSAITSHYGYLSLGYFFIHTDLLEAHPTQRPISQTHVRDLRNSFDSKGLLRMEHPGVVIGLGDGWNEMKNGGPHHYMISNSCPHLSRLSATGNGPIGQIIRGNHRTAAIRSYARNQDTNAGQNYWYYQVLLPVTNSLPYALLHDYSCIDNLKMSFLEDSYHRLSLNYAQIAQHVYENHPTNPDQRIRLVVRDNHDKGSNIKVNGLRNMLRFKEVVPHLIRLLKSGGIWTIKCEDAYAAMVKCRVEAAIAHLIATCADQAELINSSLPSDVKNNPYHIIDVLPGGEEDLNRTSYAVGFGRGTKRELLVLIGKDSPIIETLQKVVWDSKPTYFGSVFLNPVMIQREGSAIGRYLKEIKNIYCVILLLFLGPDSLNLALPRGGQMFDEYPARMENYMDGLIKQYWIQNKAKECVMLEPPEVSRFIFSLVAECGPELEKDRLIYLPKVNSSWTYQHAPVFRRPLEVLVQRSKTWKKMVTTIHTKVMPLQTAYISCIEQPEPIANIETPVTSLGPEYPFYPPGASIYDRVTHQAKAKLLNNPKPFIAASDLLVNAEASSNSNPITMDREDVTRLSDTIDPKLLLLNHPSDTSDPKLLLLNHPPGTIDPKMLHHNYAQQPAVHRSTVHSSNPEADPFMAPQSVDSMQAVVDTVLCDSAHPQSKSTSSSSSLTSSSSSSSTSSSSSSSNPPPPAAAQATHSRITHHELSKKHEKAGNSMQSSAGSEREISPDMQAEKMDIDGTGTGRTNIPNKNGPGEDAAESSEEDQESEEETEEMVKKAIRQSLANYMDEGLDSDKAPDRSATPPPPSPPTVTPRQIQKPGKQNVPRKDNSSTYSEESEEAEDQSKQKKQTLKKVVRKLTKPMSTGRIKPLKTVIGRLPRNINKGKGRGITTQKDIDSGLAGNMGEALDSDKAPDRPVTPRPPSPPTVAPRPAGHNTQRKIEELQKEVYTLIKPDAYTSSGFESSEACCILTAYLGLLEDERKALLALSHEELVDGLKALVKKKVMRSREVEHMRSPKHKRLRRSYRVIDSD